MTQLRAKHAFEKDQLLRLKVYLPFNDLGDYTQQHPLELSGRVTWAGKTATHGICGIEFESLNAQQQDYLATCFNYFNKSPRYEN